MDLEFSKLTPAELPAVLQIYNYYVENTTVSFHMHLISSDEMRSIVFFDDPKYQTFTIRCDGELCGYVILTRYKAREAYGISAEVTVYLKPEFTGREIGGEAIRFIEKFARQQKFHSLIAIICGENTASMKVFEKNGFVKCAHYKEVGKKFDRLLDSVSYQKILD